MVIGQTISHYKILSELGRGGMGVVYKAEDTKLERPVALKFLAPHALEDPEHKARFVREAKAAARLDHQNICPVYEIDEVDGQIFLAMAFLEGQTLKDKIAERPLKLDEVLDIAIQTAQGLKAAHQKKIVHRDIKPANLMLTGEGQVKIMDFGLAQLAEGSKLTQDQTILGTPAYMSPEQARRERTGRRTDVWSLGVVIYEMVTGRLPFEGERQEAVLYAIAQEDPEPITALRAGLPMDLEWIVGKALAKAADERYQHVEEMIVDLRSLAEKLKSGKSTVVSAAAAQAAADAGTAKEDRASRAAPVRKVLLGVAAVAVVAVALLIGRRSVEAPDAPVPTAPPPSVAVMPFINSSGDPDFEYFSDGMTDELINALGKIKGLRVVGRSSVFRFKGQQYDVGDVGDRLQVGALLEGTVRKAGDRLRITAQLINAADGFELWSDRFDSEMKDVFDVQDEICRAMVGALEAELLDDPSQRIVSRSTENPKAYELYLRGWHHLHKLAPAEVEKSRPYFEEALRADPSYPLAHVGLGWHHAMSVVMGLAVPRDLGKADAEIRKALQIDDSAALAHAIMGHVKIWQWEWQAAELSLRRAIDLEPGLAQAHHSYALLLHSVNGIERAIEEARRAVELDPLNPLYRWRLSSELLYAGLYEEAFQEAEAILEADERSFPAYWTLGSVYLRTDRPEEAVEALERGRELAGGEPIMEVMLATAYAAAGRQPEARRILASLVERRKEFYASAWLIGLVHLALGEDDRALEWFETAYRERDPRLPEIRWARSYKGYERLADDPRYHDLLRRMNVPEP